MSKYDSSHDYEHIQRVVCNAARIFLSSPTYMQTMDPLLIFLSAMTHDIGDHKYLRPWQSGNRIKRHLLLRSGCSKSLASKIIAITKHVSYTFEIRSPEAVKETMRLYPELAIVQDADRLDALGPVGQARCFVFAAKGKRFRGQSINAGVRHMWEKLWRIEGLMKTERGKEEAGALWEWQVGYWRAWEEQIGGVGGVGGVLRGLEKGEGGREGASDSQDV